MFLNMAKTGVPKQLTEKLPFGVPCEIGHGEKNTDKWYLNYLFRDINHTMIYISATITQDLLSTQIRFVNKCVSISATITQDWLSTLIRFVYKCVSILATITGFVV